MRFYNVNFPPCPAADVTGIVAARQGRRPTTRFGMEAQIAPSRRTFLWVTGGPQDEDTGPGTDVTGNLEGAVTVTPMTLDLTDHEEMAALGAALR